MGSTQAKEEPLDRRILREIRERLSESRAAAEEYQRLEAALAAMGSVTEGVAGAAPQTRSKSRRRTARPRAPRGVNQARVMDAIRERPGITVAELSAVTGITRNALYGLTRTLVGKGEIERVTLPGDTFGFRVKAAGDGATTVGENAAPSESAGSSAEQDGAPVDRDGSAND